MSDDGQQWSLLGGLCGQGGVQCLCGQGGRHWTMRKKITAGEITRGQGGSGEYITLSKVISADRKPPTMGTFRCFTEFSAF